MEETAQNEKQEVDVKRLYGTTRADVWAEEFAKVFPDVDEGTMIGWFANAMETAKTHRDREISEVISEARIVGWRNPDGLVGRFDDVTYAQPVVPVGYAPLISADWLRRRLGLPSTGEWVDLYVGEVD